MNSDPLPKTYLDIAIHDYDPVVKAKIYEIVAKSGIPQNDPYIAIFLSNAQVAATVATAPNLLQSALAKGFDVGIQKFRDFLATLRETAVKEQEVAISQAILTILFFINETFILSVRTNPKPRNTLVNLNSHCPIFLTNSHRPILANSL